MTICTSNILRVSWDILSNNCGSFFLYNNQITKFIHTKLNNFVVQFFFIFFSNIGNILCSWFLFKKRNNGKKKCGYHGILFTELYHTHNIISIGESMNLSQEGCRSCPQIGSDWPQKWQIWYFVRLVSSTFCLIKQKLIENWSLKSPRFVPIGDTLWHTWWSQQKRNQQRSEL